MGKGRPMHPNTGALRARLLGLVRLLEQGGPDHRQIMKSTPSNMNVKSGMRTFSSKLGPIHLRFTCVTFV